MPKKSYNRRVKPTALLPETARRQFLGAQPKRAAIFVDGSNWYHKLRLLLSPTGRQAGSTKPTIYFDLRGFSKKLIEPDTLVDIHYYIGKIRRTRGDEKSETLYASQQKLLRFLQQQQVKIGFGHLISYPDGSFHEKGVDILLAVDMINLAFEKKYDIAYLLSSDTDLVPAVEECKRLGREVVYVGSAQHGKSFGLMKCCTRSILLQSKDVLPFVPPKSE